MINSKKELKEYLTYEAKRNGINTNPIKFLYHKIRNQENYHIYIYQEIKKDRVLLQYS